MRLLFEQGDLAGQEFTIQQPAIVIGRGTTNDVVLPEYLASRQHARIQHSPQGWTLTDLGSTNGTLLNGQPIPPHQPHLLNPGDRVTIGGSVLVLRQPGEPPPQQVPARQRPSPTVLILGALVAVLVLAGIIALLVILLKPKEEVTSPESVEPLEQIQTVLPIPTSLEDIATALPLPTELEQLGTVLPVPTGVEDLATALPMPTQIEDLATALVTALPLELPKLPVGTPEP